MTPDSTPRLPRKALLRYDSVRAADVLLLPERVVKLNPSAGAILRLCDGTRSVRQIGEELASGALPGTDSAAIESDVLEFLTRVAAEGWVC